MGAQVTGVAHPDDCCWEHLSRRLPVLRRLSVSQQWLLSRPGSVSSLFPDFWIKDSSLQLPFLDKLKADSFLALRSASHNPKRTLFTLHKVPCKPHHPAHNATFFTPQTKLNWTSRKPPSSIHRLTYLGYYPLHFPLVLCSQTPHLSFPLAVQSSPPVSVSNYFYSNNQPITQYLPVLPFSVQLVIY
ncbi:hypothetical protein CHARACLAT_012074 [Characodon lateralis]|uniref:Uncharacterized protein n=1 Tax=Characodon lateralis TaxID=208331 RepID=A0ABU7DZV5_9TELE|nr:hypothetical protein [Characodon lateralis]